MNLSSEQRSHQNNKPSNFSDPDTQGNSVSRRVFKGGVLIASTKFGGIGAALAANVLLARFVSTDDFGVFFLLVTLINFGAIVGRAGLDRALVIYIAKNIADGHGSAAREALRKGLRISEVASLLVASIIFGLLFLGGEILFKIPSSVGLTAAVAVGVLLMARLNVLADSLCGYHDQLYRSLFESQSGGLLMNIVFVFLLIPCYFFGEISISVVMWLFAASIGSLLPLAALRLRGVARRHEDPAIKNELTIGDLSYKTMLALCLPLMLSQLLIFASTRTDVWIAGACCSHRELAMFGAARRLTFLISMPLVIANLAVISSIPELYRQKRIAELQRILRVSGTITAIPVIIALLPVTFFPGTILSMVYGSSYSDGSLILTILCCGQLVATLTGSCGACLLMTGHHRTMITTSLVALALLFGAGIPAATHYGAVGLATVCAVTMAGKNLWWLMAARTKIGVWTQVTIPRAIPLGRSLKMLLRR